MNEAFTRAARSRIATEGIHGLSLRTVAQDAGSSVGSLSYRVGDKAALISRVIEEECRHRQQWHETWRVRIAPLDASEPDALADIITAYLDDAATAYRESTLTGCELLLEAAIDPAGHGGIGLLLDEEDRFWASMLNRSGLPEPASMAAAIAAYCRDEMPFAVALHGNVDYRLLRAATIDRLAEGFAGEVCGLARHFEALVAACGETSAATPLPVDLLHGSKKAELAGHIADIIAEQGLGAVSHRVVAARAGVPNSSVAHHFRMRDDLINGGIGALILRLRRELGANSEDKAQGHDGMTLIRATHAIALAATRDPTLAPFALDMRRRRAENVRQAMAKAIGADDLDRAAVQAATMVLIGAGFAAMARGDVSGGPALSPVILAKIRTSRSMG